MKTLILCDRESQNYKGLDISAQVLTAVREAENEAQLVVLDGDSIRPCQGCFNCWVKTPGICIMNNDCVNEIAAQEMRSDAVIILSKITYGGYSYDIKKFLDRSIQNIMPYFEIVSGLMRHKRRYPQFPYMITIGYGDCTPQERHTFTSLVENNSFNMRPPGYFTIVLGSGVEMSTAMKSLTKRLALEV